MNLDRFTHNLRHVFQKAKDYVCSPKFKADVQRAIPVIVAVIVVGTFEPWWWDEVEMPDHMKRKLK